MPELILEQKVANLLVSLKLTIAVAESCTGGLISHRLTNVSGSSDYFEMGVVTYSNRSKMTILKVPEIVFDNEGAVSGICVEAMATGVRTLANTDLGLAVSGIAGPTGGSADKPVGTVYLALAGPKKVQTWRFQFTGNRQEIKMQTSEEALIKVTEHLLTYCQP